MRSDRLARLIVSLYPRAWRARYEDEFLALLDARPVTLRVLLDVARGCAREHASRALGSPSPLVRLTLRVLVRLAGAIALAIVIARSAWDLTSYLDAHGWTSAPIDLSRWSLVLGVGLFVRPFVASFGGIVGERRWAVGRIELGLWLTVAFASVVFEFRDQVYLQNLPWNLNSHFDHDWTDAALRLSTPLMLLMSGTKAAAADSELNRSLRKRPPDVPTSILGLNR